MSINYQTHNIIHSFLFSNGLCDLNISYNSSNSIYDLSIQDIKNTIFINEDAISSGCPISYGLSFINDPIGFSQNIQKYKRSYANHILFFHKPLPPYLKKEDIYLINNDIDRYEKYSFCKQVSEIKNIKHIEYGLTLNITNSDLRQIDVIILYSTEETQANILKNIISSNGISCDMLCTKTNKDIDKIKQKLNNAKICIDTTDYYNVLFAVSCGCYGLTSNTSNDSGFIGTIDNFQNCLSSIKDILSNYNQEYILKVKNYIPVKYNYEIFTQAIQTIISNNYYRAVQL